MTEKNGKITKELVIKNIGIFIGSMTFLVLGAMVFFHYAKEFVSYMGELNRDTHHWTNEQHKTGEPYLAKPTQEDIRRAGPQGTRY